MYVCVLHRNIGPFDSLPAVSILRSMFMYMSLSYINLLFQAILKPHLLNSAELIVRQHGYSTIFGISAGGKSEKRPKEHRGTSASEEQHPAPAVSISETRPTWMWIGEGS